MQAGSSKTCCLRTNAIREDTTSVPTIATRAQRTRSQRVANAQPTRSQHSANAFPEIWREQARTQPHRRAHHRIVRAKFPGTRSLRVGYALAACWLRVRYALAARSLRSCRNCWNTRSNSDFTLRFPISYGHGGS